MTYGVSEKSLSIGSSMVSHRCRFTTFSIVRSPKPAPKRRASYAHQRSYKLSKFEIHHRKEENQSIILYVAMHKERFHLVVSGSDAMAIAAVKNQIAAEEHTRQRLKWIQERTSALDAMTIHERASHEAQYKEISRALIDWRESVHPFSSFKWNGQENTLAMGATDPMDPCLLCEAGVTHMVPIMRFDINDVSSNQTRTFADSPVEMEAEITHDDANTEHETPVRQRGVGSNRTLFERWMGSLQRSRAKTLIPDTLSLREKMFARTSELRARIR